MIKKILFRALLAVGIFAIEVAVATGIFLMLAIIVFGMMSGCTTAQEFIHIFI